MRLPGPEDPWCSLFVARRTRPWGVAIPVMDADGWNKGGFEHCAKRRGDKYCQKPVVEGVREQQHLPLWAPRSFRRFCQPIRAALRASHHLPASAWVAAPRLVLCGSLWALSLWNSWASASASMYMAPLVSAPQHGLSFPSSHNVRVAACPRAAA